MIEHNITSQILEISGNLEHFMLHSGITDANGKLYDSCYP